MPPPLSRVGGLSEGMILDIDIWRSANLLMKEHGVNAPIQAAMTADSMLAKGGLEGYAVWKRIIWAAAELQATAPLLGKEVH